MGDASAAEGLGAQVRGWLLALARRSIAQHLQGARPEQPAEIPALAERPGGCFVSLHHRGGALRGCIGTFADAEPLWQNVRAMAVAAATTDPRFAPLRAHELPDCVLEISVLSPRFAARPEDVRVGEHGISLRLGSRRGLLLPQVAVHHGWDAPTFLSQTCLKAGLDAGAWQRPDIAIELFTAEVFSEE